MVSLHSAASSTLGEESTPIGRILHVINGEHYAGAERVQDLLAVELPKFGYEVGFACVKPKMFPQRRQANESPLYQISMRSKFDLSSVKSLAEIAKVGGYDAIHAHTTRALLFTAVAARLSKRPFLYHVHSPTIHDSTRRFANFANALVERICLKGVSRMVCVSNSLADHMRSQGFGPEMLAVVQNGVPSRVALPTRQTPSSPWILGTIALFRPRKGLEVLLEALSRVRKAGHDVRLRAVGPFETEAYESKILTLADRLEVSDGIDWVGFTDNVNRELDRMDAMVLPSLFGEGLPMVVIEAMAAGVPVISTRVQGIPEVITDGNGLLAEPGDAGSLADCIQKLLDGEVDWQLLRRNAYRRQVENFSAESMARGVAEVYDQVLGVQRSARSAARESSEVEVAQVD